MSVQGLCDVCESASASHRCGTCGAMVCAEHFDADAGYCVECAGYGGGRQL